MMEKRGANIPFSWEMLTGPRAKYKQVKIAPTWIQFLWYIGSYLLWHVAYGLTSIADRSPWAWGVSGYDYEDALHDKFRVKTKSVKIEETE